MIILNTREGEKILGLENAKDGKLLYHLTELGNLESIVKNGLQSRKQLKEGQRYFIDVADTQIISQREMLNLDTYIPFHFHPYSAFDVAVKKSHAEDKMLYICVSRVFAKNNQFKILTRHPLSEEKCVLYDFDEGMNKIDWKTLMQVGNYTEDAKTIKMAEALCDRTIYIKEFQSIAVANDEDKNMVENILDERCVVFPPPFVDIRPTWF